MKRFLIYQFQDYFADFVPFGFVTDEASAQRLADALNANVDTQSPDIFLYHAIPVTRIAVFLEAARTGWAAFRRASVRLD